MTAVITFNWFTCISTWCDAITCCHYVMPVQDTSTLSYSHKDYAMMMQYARAMHKYDTTVSIK